MNKYLLISTIPVTTLAILYARWEYRKKGKLTILGLLLICVMMFIPNLILHYAATYTPPSNFLDYVGVLIGGIGLALALISIVVFHSVMKVFCMDPGNLSTTGPYRWSRNPQYVGWVLFLIGFSLNDWSFWSLSALVASGIGIHLLVLIEEEHLLRTFGDQYKEYCRKIPRYISSKSNLTNPMRR